MSDGTARHAPGMPRTAPQSLPELPGYWRERCAAAQRGAGPRSADYARGTAFRACAEDLEGALAAQGAYLAAAKEERDRLAKQLADLRMSLDYCAGQWESNANPHTMAVSLPSQRLVYAKCAIDLRAALKANAPDAADVRAEVSRLRDLLGEVLDEFERVISAHEPTSLTSRSDIEDWRQRAAPEDSQ